MKWLFLSACLLVLLVTPAIAGGPYIAVVGNDVDANPFYLSPKYQQFLHNFSACGESFNLASATVYPEICDMSGGKGCANPNARLQGGKFEWVVNLPKTPTGEINLCIQCGVITSWEMGETLTVITATGNPLGGTPFNLTAFRNPGTYNPAFVAGGAIVNDAATQVLDGVNTRILLKSCMDKCIVVKLPVTGQVNALGQVESHLEEGDVIKVRMNVPNQVGRFVYCHEESLRVMGIGD